MGFVGFGTMSGDLGYVPHTHDDSDSQLDGDFRMVLRKLTKKDVVTKLKVINLTPVDGRGHCYMCVRLAKHTLCRLLILCLLSTNTLYCPKVNEV